MRDANIARTTAVTLAARAAGVHPSTAKGRIDRGETLEQALDKPDRRERYESANGVVGTLAEHARRLGMSRQAIFHRIANGWPVVDAISLPRDATRSPAAAQ